MDSVTVTLPSPVTVNGETVAAIVLTREPTGKDLGNHSVMDLVVDGNRRALAHVTARIGSPALPSETIKGFGLANLMALQSGYAAFLDGTDFDALVTKTSSTATPTDVASSGRKT